MAVVLLFQLLVQGCGGDSSEVPELSVALSEETEHWYRQSKSRSSKDGCLEPGCTRALLGVYELASGNYSEASERFMAAWAESGNHRRRLDLAASNLILAQRASGAEDRAQWTISALNQLLAYRQHGEATRRWQINYATSLQFLGLRTLARQAWAPVATGAVQDRWTAYALEQIEEGSKLKREERWKQTREHLESELRAHRVELALVEQAATDFPFFMRVWAEETLLPSAALMAGQDASLDAHLRTAESVGGVLHRQNKDPSVQRSAMALRRALETDPTIAAEAHASFAEGMRLYHRGATTAAEVRLRSAASTLDQLESPLALRAALYAAICRYYVDVDAAKAELTRLVARGKAEGLPSLEGRAAWMLGTISVVQNRLKEGAAWYERALDLLRVASGPAQSSFVHTLLAAAETARGRYRAAWGQRIRGLDDIWIESTARRYDAALGEAQQALIAEGHLEIALLFATEYLAVAHAREDWFGVVQAYIDKAEIELARDDRNAARSSASAARTHVGRMPDGDLQRELIDQLELVEGAVGTGTDASPQSALIAEAMARQVARGYLFDEVKALRLLGSAAQSTGHADAALRFRQKALGEVLERRYEVEDPLERVGLIDLAEDVGLETLESYAEVDSSVPNWLRYAEQTRSLSLRDLRSRSGQEHVTESAERGDSTILHFTALRRRLVVVCRSEESAVRVEVDESRGSLEELAEAAKVLLRNRSSDLEVLNSLDKLSGILIKPVEDCLPAEGRLIIVPDRVLAGLPFAAMRLQSGDFLGTKFVLSKVPSLGMLSVEEPSAWRAPRGVAVLVQEGPVEVAGRDYPAPPDALSEALTVARLYGEDDLQKFQPSVSELAAAEVVHFAGHAVAVERPAESRLLLGRPDLPYLGYRDLKPVLPGQVRVATLAACETLAGASDGGFGIGGLLFAVGVDFVVGAEWQVSDRYSKLLMIETHRQLTRGVDPPTALHRATATIRRERPSTPIADWSAFSVVGG